MTPKLTELRCGRKMIVRYGLLIARRSSCLEAQELVWYGLVSGTGLSGLSGLSGLNGLVS